VEDQCTPITNQRRSGLHEVSQRSIAGVGRVISFGSIWETPSTRKALVRESMCKSIEVEEEDGVKIIDWTALECCTLVFSRGKPRSWYIVAIFLSHIQEASMACASICLIQCICLSVVSSHAKPSQTTHPRCQDASIVPMHVERGLILVSRYPIERSWAYPWTCCNNRCPVHKWRRI
jgi:hypothetical protein